MSHSPWIAALIALFVWWFSTGAILWRVKTADKRGTHRASVLLFAPVLALGIWGMWRSTDLTTVDGAYAGFFAALAIWGWIELAFLSGVITGPNTRDCPADVPEWERFIRAWGTVAYHEILLTVALFGVLWLSWDAPNMFGFWTFAILYFARVSAKLNLFLGVPKINVEFLPSTLTHLQSHFRIAQLNPLFPVSITALTFAAACWLERLYVVETPWQAVGFALLMALTVLALLEHWLMVAKLPDEKLWRWMLPAPKDTNTTTEKGNAHGL